MLKKLIILMIGVAILTGCALSRDQIREGSGFAESKSTAKGGFCNG